MILLQFNPQARDVALEDMFPTDDCLFLDEPVILGRVCGCVESGAVEPVLQTASQNRLELWIGPEIVALLN